jgi:hypothetical protein
MIAVIAGGAALVGTFFLSIGVAFRFIFLMPWLLGIVAAYHAVRAQSLPTTRRDEIEDRARRALHFSVFSLSITAIFVLIALMAWWFMSSGM